MPDIVKEAEYWAFIASCRKSGGAPQFCENNIYYEPCMVNGCKFLSLEYIDDAYVLIEDND